MQRQDRVGNDAGNQCSDEHRNVKEEVERDDGSEKLRQVGGHRADLGDDPHREGDGF